VVYRQKKDTGEIEVVVEDMRILDPEAPYLSPDLLAVVTATKATGATEEGGEKLSAAVNKYANRTHTCGELTEAHVGQDVTLCGWLEFQRMKKFLVLRDGYGCTQVVVPTEDQAQQLKGAGVEMNLPSPDLDGIPYESIIKVTGTVSARPAGMVNEKMGTGYIEVYMKTFEVLNAAKKSLPIELRDHNRSGEVKRLEHRYIDLRCAAMQKNLRTRSQVCMRMREYLINRCGFVEIETPTLFRRTPGGAQEFVVPSRKRGHFYSLVQSPQQFKQMLMAGAFDRYFQIARCYRDEATRPDRQPEFTQLDIEMSFTDRDQIMSLIETVLVKSWPEREGCLSTPFRRMTYDQAMDHYGSDKPDTRYDMLLKNVTPLLLLNEELTKDYKNFGAYALVVRSPKCVVPQTMMGTMKKVAHLSKAKFVFSKISSVSWEFSQILL
jgi:aspartyl-tRNA synthetase